MGSFNLTKYVVADGEGGYDFDTTQLERDIPHVVRAMDNVIDRTIYPLERQRQEALNKRRMGLGVMGLANAIEALGFAYGSGGFLFVQENIMQTIRNCVYEASTDLAKEKGAFPLFDKDKYWQGAFIKTLPHRIQARVYEYGIRNSHLLSVAPTGTISFCADYVSSGIEPVFSYGGKRRVIMPEGEIVVDVSDYGLREFGVRGKLSADVTAQEHINVLSVASKYVDSAVSKTCNVSPDMPWEDFKNLYMQAWKNGCKGCTTFNPGGKRMGILMAEPTAKKEPTEEACSIDPETGRRECT